MKKIPNEETAAICGLFCGTCPCFPNECHGCLSDKLTDFCKVCNNGFRDCASEHNVVRCYDCAEFPCDRLNYFKDTHIENGIGHHKNVIDNLITMKKIGVLKWVEQQTTENTCKNCDELIYWMDKNSHKCK